MRQVVAKIEGRAGLFADSFGGIGVGIHSDPWAVG
jgi:hypothetical protein